MKSNNLKDKLNEDDKSKFTTSESDIFYFWNL